MWVIAARLTAGAALVGALALAAGGCRGVDAPPGEQAAVPLVATSAPGPASADPLPSVGPTAGGAAGSGAEVADLTDPASALPGSPGEDVESVLEEVEDLLDAVGSEIDDDGR